MSEIVKYPEINVKLTGNNGNAFVILGLVSSAMSRGGAAKDDIDAFKREAMCGDYDSLLRTCMKYVNIE